MLNRNPDLSHHHAYQSKRGGFLVFTNLLVIARHGYMTMTSYFLVRKDRAQHKRRSPWSFSAICQQVCNDVVAFGNPHMDRRSRISLPLGSCFLRATFSMKFSAFNFLPDILH